MPSPNATPTPITPPRVPLVDPRTGMIDRAWYLFFLSLNNIATAVVDDTVLGPSSESLIASYDAALQALAQEVETQPPPVDLSAELIKQIEAAGLIDCCSGLLSQVAEMQKQIQALNLLPPPAQGTITAVTATTPVVSSGGTAPDISMPAASTSVSGYLTSTDWNTFNSKAPATSGTSILYGNGSGGFSNVTIGTGVSFAAGTLSATGSGGTVTSVTGTAPVVSSGGTTPAISMAAANTSTNGYLTSTDWNTFNGKGSGTVTSVAALTLGTTGTDLTSTVANGTTTPVITLNVPTASASNRGALSAADWTTFNNKGSGTVTTVSFTGGIITVANPTTTPAFTVAGTSGGIPYFSSGTTWASSAALTQYGVVYGGGAGATPVATAAGTTGQVLTATTGGAPSWAAPATSGTVTSVSVVSANGFAGTVATATTTPAITLTTSITGLLKGNGTAISAAVVNTDYFAPSAPVTKTANFTVAATEVWLINNKTGSTCTATLPAASSWSGRVLYFQNYQAQTLVSASSNVVPLAGGAAATSILLASTGDSATLVSDGTNWLMTQYIPNNILLLE